MRWNTKTLSYLELYCGFVGQIVEHYNGFSGKKQDFMGYLDAICLNPDGNPYKVVGVQITSRGNISARWRKMSDVLVKDKKTGEMVPNVIPDKVKMWLQCGNGLMIIGWNNQKPKDLTGKIRQITLDSDNNLVYDDKEVTICLNRKC